MQIKTSEGIAEGFPQSDLQRNNKLLENIIKLGWSFFILICIVLIWVIYKIIRYDVFNNTIRALGGC